MRASAALFALPILAVTSPAVAGRTHYGWLYGTDVNPERGVELETWIYEENDKGDEPDVVDETLVWWAPVVGINDHVEVAIPLELAWTAAGTNPGVTQLVRFGGEVRWRLDPPEQPEAGRFTTMLRAGVKRVIAARDGVRGEVDVVVAFESGRFHAEVDLGAIAERGKDDDVVELRPGAGISIEVIPDLRVGAEGYAELGVAGDPVDWLAVGPNLAWTHGRFWLSAAFGIGIFGVDTAPRINFAVAF
jgi:hypothetical protein